MTVIPQLRKQQNRTLTKIIMKYGSTKVKQRKGYLPPDSSHESTLTEDELFERVTTLTERIVSETSNFFEGLAKGLPRPSENINNELL